MLRDVRSVYRPEESFDIVISLEEPSASALIRFLHALPVTDGPLFTVVVSVRHDVQRKPIFIYDGSPVKHDSRTNFLGLGQNWGGDYVSSKPANQGCCIARVQCYYVAVRKNVGDLSCESSKRRAET